MSQNRGKLGVRFSFTSLVLVYCIGSIWAAKPGFVKMENGYYIPSQIQSTHYLATSLEQCITVPTDREWHYCPEGQNFHHIGVSDTLSWVEYYVKGTAWTVAWEGEFLLYETETVDFNVNYDMWVILYIDGDYVFSELGSHGVKNRIISLHLEAGIHQIRLVYFDDYEGGGHIYLAWSSPTIPYEWIGPAVLPSCTELLKESIETAIVDDGYGMNIKFQPKYNLTLRDAAHICGCEYFNWFQLVLYDDDPMRPTVNGIQPSLPYIDPPYGGYDKGVPADHRDGYWDEGGQGWPSHQLYLFTHPYYLLFEDEPLNTTNPLYKYHISFATCLLAIHESGKSFVLADCVYWDSTNEGIISVRRNTDKSLRVSPGITLLGVYPVSQLDPISVAYMTENGIEIEPYPCGFPPEGDFDEDCMVGLSDLNIFAQSWLSTGTAVDLDDDNIITINDLAKIAGNWLIDCNISTGHPACPFE
ncbi:MAG: hypothetical protein GX455_05400 [Phycisphaerae bacterium]|nr:hypothetical protein [Phycisphaerae bacterium]